jgi:hypothetical protein
MKRSIHVIFIMTFIGCMIFSFMTDFHNTMRYGGIDLRTRVVGVRVAQIGEDPYFFQWQPGMPDTLLDPQVEFQAKSSRLTVPPTVLLLHLPFSNLTYLQQKLIWLSVQWISFLVLILIFLSKSKSIQSSLLICLISLCFAHSFVWKLHVERGQLYILYSCLFTLAWLLYKTRINLLKLCSGTILGLTICLRPSAFLILIPFLANRRWFILLGSILGMLLGFILPTLILEPSLWNSYFSAMRGITQYFSKHRRIPDNDWSTSIAQAEFYPKTIEGLDFVAQSKDIPNANSSVQNTLMSLGIENIDQIQNILLVIFLLISILIIKKIAKRGFSNNLIFFQGIVLYILSEFLLPSPRYSYNDIQWLVPLMLMVNEAKNPSFFRHPITLALIVSLLLSMGMFMWISRYMLFSSLLMIVFVCISWFRLLNQNQGLEKL